MLRQKYERTTKMVRKSVRFFIAAFISSILVRKFLTKGHIYLSVSSVVYCVYTDLHQKLTGYFELKTQNLGKICSSNIQHSQNPLRSLRIKNFDRNLVQKFIGCQYLQKSELCLSRTIIGGENKTNFNYWEEKLQNLIDQKQNFDLVIPYAQVMLSESRTLFFESDCAYKLDLVIWIH